MRKAGPGQIKKNSAPLNKLPAHPSEATEHAVHTLMKKLIALLAVATGIGFIAPAESSARDYCHNDRRIVSHHSCGAPIYSVYQVCGHDRWGRPMGRWVTQHVSHSSCRSCYPRHGYGHGHHHHGHSSRYRSGPPMPPHHRAAASFFFGFGR